MTTDLVSKVPASIFSIDDFKDAKIEWDMPELTYEEYKPLRAAEYCETHAVDLDDDAQETLADELVAEADADLEEALASDRAAEERGARGQVELDNAAAEKAKRKAKKKVAKKKVVKKKATSRANSKKAQTIAIYGEVTASGGGRKEGIARLTSELGLSAAGASTYWQNVKSGKWA